MMERELDPRYICCNNMEYDGHAIRCPVYTKAVKLDYFQQVLVILNRAKDDYRIRISCEEDMHYGKIADEMWELDRLIRITEKEIKKLEKR